MKPRLVIFAALAASSLFALAANSITRLPPPWTLTGKTPEHYEIGLDSGVTVSGQGAKSIRNTGGNGQGWATLMQGFSAKNYVGKRVRFQAQVKTSDVTAAGLWMRVDDSSGDSVAFYNSQDKPIKGSTDWQLRSVVLDVPPQGTQIFFGVLHYGKGQVWMDALSVEVVGNDVPVDAPAGKKKLPETPSL